MPRLQSEEMGFIRPDVARANHCIGQALHTVGAGAPANTGTAGAIHPMPTRSQPPPAAQISLRG